MTNRKFSVELHNKISAVSHYYYFFFIAHNKLWFIIELYKEIDSTAYAEDFNLIKSSHKTKFANINLCYLRCSGVPTTNTTRKTWLFIVAF